MSEYNGIVIQGDWIVMEILNSLTDSTGYTR